MRVVKLVLFWGLLLYGLSHSLSGVGLHSTDRSPKDTATLTAETSKPNLSDAAPAEKTDSLVKGYVTGRSVNLRAGPGTVYEVIGTVKKGDVVTILNRKTGWAEITVPNGHGWIATQYLGGLEASDTVSVAPGQTLSERQRTISAPSPREVQQAKNEIIQQSIDSYPGSCPCPYNVDRAGRRCGGRSAWSKPGGYSPICYDSDISEDRLKSYFARLRGAVE